MTATHMLASTQRAGFHTEVFILGGVLSRAHRWSKHGSSVVRGLKRVGFEGREAAKFCEMNRESSRP